MSFIFVKKKQNRLKSRFFTNEDSQQLKVAIREVFANENSATVVPLSRTRVSYTSTFWHKNCSVTCIFFYLVRYALPFFTKNNIAFNCLLCMKNNEHRDKSLELSATGG